jgi:ferrochelatase
MAKTAVVLFNLGGPDRLEAVRPFLFNLFNDPSIIELPAALRWPLAKFISTRRAPLAREIYAHLGGGSPLLANTQAQADALSAALHRKGGNARAFIAMRYWHPFAHETAQAVKDYAPERIVLLPLYPQYSASTTGSSLADWRAAARKAGLSCPSHAVCCYPANPGFIAAVAEKVRVALGELAQVGAPAPRVLFSAHGLPKRMVDAGDPYQWQVERSVAAIVAALGVSGLDISGLDWTICYQSRVGPLEWLGPSTDAEIERCGKVKRPAVVVPVAFVSEHSETLVELDIEYKKLADRSGVPRYLRVATVGTDSAFIDGLAALVRAAETGGALCRSPMEAACPGNFVRCPHFGAAA